MSASVSVPIISAVEDEVRTQLVTVTFSTGRAGCPSRAIAFRTIASSAVSMIESEPRLPLTAEERPLIPVSGVAALTPVAVRSEASLKRCLGSSQRPEGDV